MSKTLVFFVQYTNPAAYPPVMNAATILAEQGCEVTLIGTGAHGDADRLKMPSHANIRVKLSNYCPPGMWQKIHFLGFSLRFIWNALIHRPDFVYASDQWSYPVGWCVSWIPGRKVILHEHDTPASQGGLLVRCIQWFRRRLAKRAVTCVIPQADRARRFAMELEPHDLRVVWNCPRHSEIPQIAVKPERCGFVLWYHGSIVPGQFPDSVIKALTRLPKNVSLRFAGYETIGHPGYVERLMVLATTLGVRERIEYIGTTGTRRDLFAEAAKCDIGLVLFARKFREPMAGASNKPFDYMACGLALLMPDTQEWKEFYENEGFGRSCNPNKPQAIVSAIEHWIRATHELRRIQAAVRMRMLEQWNYDEQFKTVLALLVA